MRATSARIVLAVSLPAVEPTALGLVVEESVPLGSARQLALQATVRTP